MEYKVIVIGGGIAGLTSAAYLSKRHIKTLLIEKNSITGGLVNTFTKDQFSFDGGIRAFENSGILFPMLKNLGIEIDFVKNPVSLGIKNQIIHLKDEDSLTDYANLLKSTFKDNHPDIDKIIKEIKKVSKYMDVLYGIDNPLFQENMQDKEYLFKTLLPWLFKYMINIKKASKLNEPIYAYLKKFTNNQSLIDMIAQHFFKDTPTFFALSYFKVYLDYVYPKNGTSELTNKITKYILDNHNDILLNTEVIKINQDTKEITLSNQEIIKYQKLIWAADQKTLYKIINQDTTKKVKKQAVLIENSFGGDSVLTLFLSVDLDPSYFEKQIGPHAFYTPSTDGISSIENHKIVDYIKKTTYEISIPTLRNKALSPNNQTSIIISTVIHYDIINDIINNNQYVEFKKISTETIIDVLNTSIFKDFKKHIINSSCATPKTIKDITKNDNGAITGWAFTNKNIPCVFDFKKIRKAIYTPIKDIYQAGMWTFSPSGLPVSILTGKLASDQITKELGVKK